MQNSVTTALCGTDMHFIESRIKSSQMCSIYKLVSRYFKHRYCVIITYSIFHILPNSLVIYYMDSYSIILRQNFYLLTRK